MGFRCRPLFSQEEEQVETIFDTGLNFLNIVIKKEFVSLSADNRPSLVVVLWRCMDGLDHSDQGGALEPPAWLAAEQRGDSNCACFSVVRFELKIKIAPWSFAYSKTSEGTVFSQPCSNRALKAVLIPRPWPSFWSSHQKPLECKMAALLSDPLIINSMDTSRSGIRLGCKTCLISLRKNTK